MSDERKRSFGILMRRLRLQKRRPDGSSWTQKYLAERAGVSVKTVGRLEREGEVGPKSLSKILDALDVNDQQRNVIENQYNQLRVQEQRLDQAESSRIRQEIQNYMLYAPHLTPAYILDEYWFTRAHNVYILALHRIKPEMLTMPELWHNIATKFQSKLDVRKLRGPQWEDYYLYVMKAFRSSVAPYESTNRFFKLTKWLKKLEDFADFWDYVGGDFELGYELRARMTRPVPVHLDSEKQLWKVYEIEALVSSQLPKFRLIVWIPAEKRWPATLQRLNKTARELGYDVDKYPVVFIEDYISESKLRQIGGWLE